MLNTLERTLGAVDNFRDEKLALYRLQNRAARRCHACGGLDSQGYLTSIEDLRLMTLARVYPIVIALTLCLALAGCAAGPRVKTHTAPSADFSDYATFAFIDKTGAAKGALSPKVTEYFKSASRRELTALGYRYDSEDPDLLVNFFINAERHEDVRLRADLQSMGGYYDYRYGMYSTWPVYTLEQDTNQYETGTVTIDLVDAQLEQLVWEGRLEGRLTQRIVSNPGGVISDAVADILAKAPAAPR